MVDEAEILFGLWVIGRRGGAGTAQLQRHYVFEMEQVSGIGEQVLQVLHCFIVV